jgi:hypothetical protein
MFSRAHSEVEQQMSGQLPIATPTKLIVLVAFDRDEEGVLRPAFEAREMPDEQRAVRLAKDLAHRHDGVIAWSRSAKLNVGEFGEPTELYRAGEVPDMD